MTHERRDNMEITKLPTLPVLPKKRKVAAYARVSSGKDSMLNSLSQQVSYFSSKIQANKDWLYVGVYADEAYTGTKDDRSEFQRMLKDCKEGKIDLILTKSISRFARNTVTLLQAVRDLASIGVEIYFEEQNIYTLSSEGEFLITILASYAQEEARSVSENQLWRVKRNFENGIPWGAWLYGYNVIKNEFYVNEEEAKVVKLIYQWFLEGMGKGGIATELNNRGIPAYFGGPWSTTSVMQILKNYDYTGNLLLQKTYRKDFMSKKDYINRGEKPKYHVEEHHEAIIDLETWMKVQKEIERRCSEFTDRQNHSFLKGKIKCGHCSKSLLRKVSDWRTFWICATYMKKGKNGCPAKRIDDEDLMTLLEEIQNSTRYDIEEDIKKIIINPDHTLEIIFNDGFIITRTWEERSRSKSWTPEMREMVRQRELERGRLKWQKSQ